MGGLIYLNVKSYYLFPFSPADVPASSAPAVSGGFFTLFPFITTLPHIPALSLWLSLSPLVYSPNTESSVQQQGPLSSVCHRRTARSVRLLPALCASVSAITCS